MQALLNLFSLSNNVFFTLAQVLLLAAAFFKGIDKNQEGTDDLVGGCLVALSEGVEEYAENDKNTHGNIVDALISALTRYRNEMELIGIIKPAIPVGSIKRE